MIYDAIIIGGGAAGLFCAIEAAKRGRKTLVLEHNSRVGRKIIISGGGRANFTNLRTSAENFISENPHFCKSALARFTPHDFLSIVKKHGIDHYEKKLGQLFCRESSLKIVEMLLDECRAAKVEIRLNCSVNDACARPQSGFAVETNQGTFESENLVIASGGLSIPKIGATGLGYRIASKFGHKIVTTRPALVPLVFDRSFPAEFKKLAGVSLDTVVSNSDATFRENLLFTHRGLSGPAILQISSYWKKGEEVSIDLFPDGKPLASVLNSGDKQKFLSNYLAEFLPKRFADIWTEKYASAKPVKGFSEKELARVSENLHNWKIRFEDSEGYAKAEVTAGGVSTAEISSQTMESKRFRGLYFIGEVVDVTGWLGGYNFQWAWSSGFAAGQSV